MDETAPGERPLVVARRRLLLLLPLVCRSKGMSAVLRAAAVVGGVAEANGWRFGGGGGGVGELAVIDAKHVVVVERAGALCSCFGAGERAVAVVVVDHVWRREFLAIRALCIMYCSNDDREEENRRKGLSLRPVAKSRYMMLRRVYFRSMFLVFAAGDRVDLFPCTFRFDANKHRHVWAESRPEKTNRACDEMLLKKLKDCCFF